MGTICISVSQQLPHQFCLISQLRLRDAEFEKPRKGKNNDKAHPPIHPTAHAANLAGDESRVYEFIARRFLASCSKDAVGSTTTVDVVCGEEHFYATGISFLFLSEYRTCPSRSCDPAEKLSRSLSI